MSAVYPKILIVGQYFDKKSGSGITMTNLFAGWEKKNIAVLAEDIVNPDFSVCVNVYRIGEMELERDFPFNLHPSKERIHSGVIQAESENSGNSHVSYTPSSKIGGIKDKLLIITGQIHRRRRYLLSKELLLWITEFSPDIIYSQLSSLDLILFVNKIHEIIKKPLALHIMDDWPSTITNGQKGIFKSYWTQLISNKLIQLFKKADVLMSISESMSEEYKVRYNSLFIPFHNPIDVKYWTSKNKKDYSFQENFKILYAGRIGTGLQTCLIDIANAIRNIINQGLKIEFHIQATVDNPVLKELVKFDFVILRNQVPYEQLPGIFSSVDLLLLPNDFDDESVSFLKYSMPTKASEYMVSGTPILVYSSIETAITKHAMKYNWGYVVSENSSKKLETGIIKLYKDKDMRRDIGCRAKEFATEHFDSFVIRRNFKNALRNSLTLNLEEHKIE